MKVGSLFAEIGFTVNTKGLNTFNATIRNLRKQISELKKELNFTQEKTPKAQKNKTNETAPKIGSSGRVSAPILKALSTINFGNFVSMIAKGVGSIFGPLAALRAQYIGKMVDRVINTMVRMSTWLGRTILSGIRFGMAYRDYRNFTGRNTSSLGGLMGRTFNTQNMRPEDVLRDAAALETQYWDMILGGGNPAFYQLLGLHPTGTGEIDLQNIISSIGIATDNFSRRGLARSLFKMGGLSEEYLNMVLDRQPGNVDVNTLLANSEAYERANKAIRDFEWQLLKIKGDLAKEFVDSGLLDSIKEAVEGLSKNLPGIVSLFKDLFVVLRNILDWFKEKFPEWFGVVGTTGNLNNFYKIGSQTEPLNISKLAGLNTENSFSRQSNISMNNNYYLNTTDEVSRVSNGVINSANTMASREGYTWQKQANDTMMEYSKP